MQNEWLEVYTPLDLTAPRIPPRSRCHHLKEIGMGTPLVEALCSYNHRLARSHHVTVQDFALPIKR